MTKLHSPACHRNRDPILSVLRTVFANCAHVLEVGSGTGEHAVYFASAMPHLQWHTSDLPLNHASILAWRNEAGLLNVRPPLAIDVSDLEWPVPANVCFDAAFTANTCHIMSWVEVQALFTGLSRILEEGGIFCIYGPFKYGGDFTSPSNAQFDAALRAQIPHRGIRDMEEIVELANMHHFMLQTDNEMPANNRLLVFRLGTRFSKNHSI